MSSASVGDKTHEVCGRVCSRLEKIVLRATRPRGATDRVSPARNLLSRFPGVGVLVSTEAGSLLSTCSCGTFVSLSSVGFVIRRTIVLFGSALLAEPCDLQNHFQGARPAPDVSCLATACVQLYSPGTPCAKINLTCEPRFCFIVTGSGQQTGRRPYTKKKRRLFVLRLSTPRSRRHYVEQIFFATVRDRERLAVDRSCTRSPHSYLARRCSVGKRRLKSPKFVKLSRILTVVQFVSGHM